MFARKTIVVAMSGGVDSSVVAAMMHHAGHNVIGITLQLYDHGMALQKKGACCAGQDIYDAKLVADKLGFPHYVFDYESKFKQQVIDDFADSYMRGETPLPCVRCNQSVKFNDLLKAAKELKADALATGHYVQKIVNNGIAELHKGISEDKDQSYFLFSTTQEQLDYLMFPLGAQTKEETREMAQKFGLDIANKPDSQDICFVPHGNYREVVAKIRPEANKPGRFLHIDGYDLGEHKGVINYTVGQRKGLGIAFGQPVYVIKIDPETNTVYVGPESALVKTKFLLKNINWLAGDKDPGLLEVTVKIRSTTRGVKAKLIAMDDGSIEVNLLGEEKAITPGQACVFYEGSRVLGGGWITREINNQ
ncbi:MAG: tRNA 2-thiouridine(34) synthase MnmA [Rickettsiaceae bacterium]